MIAELQQYLKEVLVESTDIPEEYVYTTLKDSNAYTITPFASVLPESAQIEPAWQKEQVVREQARVLRKYKVSQPWTINIVCATAKECMDNTESFLEALHHKTVCHNTIAEWEPSAVEFLLAEGEMDHYEARLSVVAKYGIYTQKEVDTIKDIKVESYVE